MQIMSGFDSAILILSYFILLSKESALVYITLIVFVRRRLFWSFFLDVGLLSITVISVASVI